MLVATGFHRLTTTAELENKLGPEIAAKEKIVVHNAFDPDSNVQIGILPSGAPLVIDRTAVETDLLISEGFIEPHFFAGFSGGRKSVLPGVCDKTTVLGNHCGEFIASPCARTGILEGNPLHRDMVAAAEMAKLGHTDRLLIPMFQHMKHEELPEALRGMPSYVEMMTSANPKSELLNLVAGHFKRGKAENVSDILREVRGSGLTGRGAASGESAVPSGS